MTAKTTNLDSYNSERETLRRITKSKILENYNANVRACIYLQRMPS